MFKTLTLAFALAAPAVLAQGNPLDTPGSHFIENWDADADGNVTLAEITERRDIVFTMFDQNEDNSLSAEEYVLFDETRAADMEVNAGAHGGGNGAGQGGQADQGGQRMMQGMTMAYNDSDADSTVSRAEFMAGSEGWFTMLDQNADGAVTADDFSPRRN